MTLGSVATTIPQVTCRGFVPIEALAPLNCTMGAHAANVDISLSVKSTSETEQCYIYMTGFLMLRRKFFEF